MNNLINLIIKHRQPLIAAAALLIKLVIDMKNEYDQNKEKNL